MFGFRKKSDSTKSIEELPGMADARALFAALKEMPQFVEEHDIRTTCFRNESYEIGSLVNMHNGALVTVLLGEVRLTWQMPGYDTTAHSCYLKSASEIEKFRRLMVRQAELLG